jgi:hypothetical protein
MRRGEIQPALRQLERAEEIFRNRCTGCAAEMRLCRQLMASLFVHAPRLAELSKSEAWAREAEEHDDQLGAARLRLLGTTLALMRDEPEQAGRCEEAARASLRPHFDVTALLHHVAMCQIHLYRGDGAACRDDVAGFEQFFHSALAGVTLWRAQCHLLRALLRLSHAASGVDAAETFAAAENDLLAVERTGLVCMLPAVKLLRASVQSRMAQHPRAMSLLDELLEGPNIKQDAPLVAACARVRKGELMGGREGAALMAEAESLMRGQGIRNPQQLARLYLPPLH